MSTSTATKRFWVITVSGFGDHDYTAKVDGCGVGFSQACDQALRDLRIPRSCVTSISGHVVNE